MGVNKGKDRYLILLWKSEGETIGIAQIHGLQRTTVRSVEKNMGQPLPHFINFCLQTGQPNSTSDPSDASDARKDQHLRIDCPGGH